MNIIILLGIHLMTCCKSKSNDHNKSATGIVKSSIFENDSIKCHDIAVKTLKIGDSKDKFERLLGKPDSINQVIDSVDSPAFEYEALFYDESEFHFYKGLFFGFRINSSKFDLNGIVVGDNISKFERKYPKSFNNGLHKGYNEFVIECSDACKLGDSKLLGPDSIIISYDDNKVIKRIGASFTY